MARWRFSETFEGRPCKAGHTTRYVGGTKACAICSRERAKAYAAENREDVRRKQHAYYLAHREEAKEYQRNYVHPDPKRQRDLANASLRRRYWANPEKARAKNREYHRRMSPETRRRRNLKANYGITPEEWRAMFDRQGGVCSICRTRPPTDTDHCHATGAVRDLLCNPCNTALGKFRDNPELMRRAAEYVEQKGLTREDSGNT